MQFQWLLLCSIGAVLEGQGKYPEALEYYNKSLKIKVKVHGQDHSDVAATLVNIANVYESQGIYDKALETCKESLKIDIKVHGPEHLDTARTYNKYALSLPLFTEIRFCVWCSLGLVFNSMGKPEKALENYNKSLAIKKKVLGCEHPLVATTQNKCAQLFWFLLLL